MHSTAKPQDFDFEQCRQRLLLLNLGDETDDKAGPADRHMRGHSLLDLGNEQLVRVAGGLARFLERNRVQLGDLDDAQQGLCVHGVQIFSPADLLCVDYQTMSALQVFSEEQHPSLIRGVGRAKEGMSLFGTPRAAVRNWIL